MQTFYDKKYYALILGGSSGIGFATAQKLASEGMNLCIVYRDRKAESKIIEEKFEKIRRAFDVKILTFNADAVEIDSITDIIHQVKNNLGDDFKIRLLLHSVSKGNLKPLVKPLKKDLNLENDSIESAYRIIQEEQIKHQQSEFYLSGTDFQLTLQNMAISLVDWVKIVFENQLFAQDARVIGLSSEGNQKAWVNYAAVSATKAALEAIIRSLALEYAPYGIRSNIVQAGITETASLNRIPGSELLKANAVYRNPFGRMTKTEDVANAIYLLCRDEASWINGAVIPVDGGERIC
jgi:enoyl-[acyl-carrier protein] reductase I